MTPPGPSAIPPWAHVGPDYEDRGGFGSFVRPAPTHAGPPLARPRGPAQLIVTSKKALKWQAALQALAARGVSAPELVTLSSPSGVPEQPIGAEQGHAGAAHRAGLGAGPEHPTNEAIAAGRAAGHTVVVVSFENFAAFEPCDLSEMPRPWHDTHRHGYVRESGEVAIDRAAVLVRVLGIGPDQQWAGVSAGVALPFAAVEASLANQQTTTAGHHLHATLGVPHDDWHGAFVPGLDRTQILQAALSLGLAMRGG